MADKWWERDQVDQTDHASAAAGSADGAGANWWERDQPAEAEEPSWSEVLRHSFAKSIGGVADTAATTIEGRPGTKPLEAETAFDREPMTFTGLVSDPVRTAKHALGGLVESSPTLGAGLAGAGLASEFGPVGSVVGGASGMALGNLAQTMGPNFRAALEKYPNDPDKAYEEAVRVTAAGTGGTFVSGLLLGVNPFASRFKNLMFQTFLVQPGAMGGTVAAERTVRGDEQSLTGAFDEVPGYIIGGLPAVAVGEAGHALTAPRIPRSTPSPRIEPLVDMAGEVGRVEEGQAAVPPEIPPEIQNSPQTRQFPGEEAPLVDAERVQPTITPSVKEPPQLPPEAEARLKMYEKEAKNEKHSDAARARFQERADALRSQYISDLATPETELVPRSTGAQQETTSDGSILNRPTLEAPPARLALPPPGVKPWQHDWPAPPRGNGPQGESAVPTPAERTQAPGPESPSLTATDTGVPGSRPPSGQDGAAPALGPKPKPGPRKYREPPPMRLAGWLRRRGGLREHRGELKHMGAGRVRGLINPNGMHPDDAAMLAQNLGYLPRRFDEKGDIVRADMNDLLEALYDDLGGRPVYSEDDLHRVQARETKARNAGQARGRKALEGEPYDDGNDTFVNEPPPFQRGQDEGHPQYDSAHFLEAAGGDLAQATATVRERIAKAPQREEGKPSQYRLKLEWTLAELEDPKRIHLVEKSPGDPSFAKPGLAAFSVRRGQREVATIIGHEEGGQFKIDVVNPARGVPAMTPEEARLAARYIRRRSGEKEPSGYARQAGQDATPRDRMTAEADARYGRAGDKVDGLEVDQGLVPDTDSIAASSTDYTVLPGIREVPFADFNGPARPTSRTRNLSEQIKASGKIKPLIVMIDEKGPYILEGAHRYDSLQHNGHKSFPAVVVVDHSGASATAADVPATKLFRNWDTPPRQTGQDAPERTLNAADVITDEARRARKEPPSGPIRDLRDEAAETALTWQDEAEAILKGHGVDMVEVSQAVVDRIAARDPALREALDNATRAEIEAGRHAMGRMQRSRYQDEQRSAQRREEAAALDRIFAERRKQVQFDEDLRNNRNPYARQAGEDEAPPASRFDAPEFKRWFGKSKIVDKDGKPKLVYHGSETGGEFTTFRPERESVYWPEKDAEGRVTTPRNVDMQRIYFSDDIRVAASYGVKNGSVGSPDAVMPAFLRMENPKYLNGRGRKWDNFNPFGDIVEAKIAGHDGVVIKNIRDEVSGSGQPSTVYVVFDPKQIKSPYNNGQWSRRTSNIMRQAGKDERTGIVGPGKVFYSQLERVVGALNLPKARGDQWLATIKQRPGVKIDELDTTGLAEWLNENRDRQVTKAEVEAHLRDNAVVLEESVYGGEFHSDEMTKAHARVVELDDQLRSIARRETHRLDEDPDLDFHDALKAYIESGEASKNLRRAHDAYLDAESALEELQAADQNGLISNDAAPRFEEWTEPGGTNYREFVLRLPARPDVHRFEVRTKTGDIVGRFETKAEAEQWAESRNRQIVGIGATVRERDIPHPSDFRTTHWPDANPIAHLRVKDRTGPNGESILHVEEIQSDWHNKGHAEGYRDDATTKRLALELDLRRGEWERAKRDLQKLQDDDLLGKLLDENDAGKLHDLHDKIEAAKDRAGDARHAMEKADQAHYGAMRAPPNAPFKNTWHELLLKRALDLATREGYDAIAWTPGKMQAERFSLARHIRGLRYTRPEKGSDGGSLVMTQHNGNSETRFVKVKDLPDWVGQETAARLLSMEPVRQQDGFMEHRLTGLDLEVGGEFHKTLYDKKVPQFLNAFGKKYGERVGATKFTTPMYGDLRKSADGRSFGFPADDHVFGSEAEARAWVKEQENRTFPSLKITDAMRKGIGEGGQPLFDKGGPREQLQDALDVMTPDPKPAKRPTARLDSPKKEGDAAILEGLTREEGQRFGKIIKEIDNAWRKIAPDDVEGIPVSNLLFDENGERSSARGVYLGAEETNLARKIAVWAMHELETPRGARYPRNPDKVLSTARHEAIHALYRGGFFTRGEWRALQQAAIEGGWIKKHDIDRLYDGLAHHLKIEEAIAMEFGFARPKGFESIKIPLVRRAFVRLHNLLTMAKAAYSRFRGQGDTAANVMRKIESGEVKKRTPGERLPGDDAPFAKDKGEATATPEFRSWFRKSHVVDKDGKPLRVYHGSNRVDRVVAGGRFMKGRATSGPMSFFTDSPELASKYTAKGDNSLGDEPPYHEQFRVKDGRRSIPFDQVWGRLSAEERARIAKLAERVHETDDAKNEMVLGDESHRGGPGGLDQAIKESRGNVLRALSEQWLSGGILFGREGEFLKVLKLAGLDMPVEYVDHHAEAPGIVPVYLSIQNPLEAHNVPEPIVKALNAAARRQPKPKWERGMDQWDKSSRDPQDWIEHFNASLNDPGTYAFTVVPDWVTRVLKNAGYDGIKDTGGKGGGPTHTVWVPFEPSQIKSTFNRGSYDPKSPNIMKQAGGDD